MNNINVQRKTRGSAVAETPRDALCHAKSGLEVEVAQGHWK